MLKAYAQSANTPSLQHILRISCLDPYACHECLPLTTQFWRWLRPCGDAGADKGVSVQQEHPLQAAGPQETLASQTFNNGNLHQPSRTITKPDGPSAQKHSLPKRSTPVHKYASAFHAASQKLPPPEQTSSTTRECDTEPSETPDAATERYQKDVYRGR